MRTAARGTTRLVPLAAAALVLCGISARLAPHGSPRQPHGRAASAYLVAEAKIPTPLETVAIRAGRTFLDPPTTDTDLYLAIVDACFDPAAQTFDEHAAHVRSAKRTRRTRRGFAEAQDPAGADAGGRGLSALRRRSLPAFAAEDEEQQHVAQRDDHSRPAAQSGGPRRRAQPPLSPQAADVAASALLLRPPADDDGNGDGTAAEDPLATWPSSTAGPVPEPFDPRRFDADPGPPHLPVVAQAEDARFVQTAARSPATPPGAAARSFGAAARAAGGAGSVQNAARSDPETTPPGAAARSSGAKASAAAVSRRKYPVRHALVEAHYKPSTQVLRLRIQTLGFRRITGMILSRRSATLPPTGRRIAKRGEGSEAGAQWLAAGGRTPATVPVPAGEDDGGDDGAAWRAAETDYRGAAGDGAFEGDGVASSGHSAADGRLGAPPPLRPPREAAAAAAPTVRRIVDRPTVRDAFWHEAKLTDDEAASLFLGELHLDIYAAGRPLSPARGFLACAQPGARCTAPPALAGRVSGGAVFRPDSCDPSNELPGWLAKYTRNRLR